jgi:hypothetical protein
MEAMGRTTVLLRQPTYMRLWAAGLLDMERASPVAQDARGMAAVIARIEVTGESER